MTSDMGRQPAIRSTMQTSSEILRQSADELGYWEVFTNVDTLQIADLNKTQEILEQIIDRANRARTVVAKAQAKRVGQSVSGRFSAHEKTGHKRRTDA